MFGSSSWENIELFYLWDSTASSPFLEWRKKQRQLSQSEQGSRSWHFSFHSTPNFLGQGKDLIVWLCSRHAWQHVPSHHLFVSFLDPTRLSALCNVCMEHAVFLLQGKTNKQANSMSWIQFILLLHVWQEGLGIYKAVVFFTFWVFIDFQIPFHESVHNQFRRAFDLTKTFDRAFGVPPFLAHFVHTYEMLPLAMPQCSSIDPLKPPHIGAKSMRRA